MTLIICLKYINRYAVETVHLFSKYSFIDKAYRAGVLIFIIYFSFVNTVNSNGGKKTFFLLLSSGEIRLLLQELFHHLYMSKILI